MPKLIILVGIVVLFLLDAFSAWPRSRSYEAIFTPFQLRRMTNDPKTNPALAKFAEKLDDPAAEAAKVVKLAAWVSATCIGARPNAGVLQKYRAERLSGLKDDQRENAEFQAQHLFVYMDYVEEAELCAGVDYVFGSKGALLPNAVDPGAGEMNFEPFIGSNPGSILMNPYAKP